MKPKASGRRFLVETLDLSATVIELPASVAHRVRHVLRMRTGDSVQLLDGNGGAVEGLLELDGSEAFVEARQSGRFESPPGHLRLGIPLLKSGNTELSLQKATELGATDLIVYAGERSVRRESVDGSENLLLRFERVVAEAVEQCGAYNLPAVAYVGHAQAAAARLGPEFLIASTGSGLPALDVVLTATDSTTVAAIVGPEGGFTDRELEAMEFAGGLQVSLGDRVLRSETAVTAVSVLAARRLGWLGRGGVKNRG